MQILIFYEGAYYFALTVSLQGASRNYSECVYSPEQFFIFKKGVGTDE